MNNPKKKVKVILNCAKYFVENRSRKYLAVQPFSKFFIWIWNTGKTSSLKSRGLSG